MSCLVLNWFTYAAFKSAKKQRVSFLWDHANTKFQESWLLSLYTVFALNELANTDVDSWKFRVGWVYNYAHSNIMRIQRYRYFWWNILSASNSINIIKHNWYNMKRVDTNWNTLFVFRTKTSLRNVLYNFVPLITQKLQ